MQMQARKRDFNALASQQHAKLLGMQYVEHSYQALHEQKHLTHGFTGLILVQQCCMRRSHR